MTDRLRLEWDLGNRNGRLGWFLVGVKHNDKGLYPAVWVSGPPNFAVGGRDRGAGVVREVWYL
jgi:hypothetical protein